MISNYLPLSAENDAPPIIRELRNAFDTRLTSLYETALTMHAADPGRPTKMFHVPFTHGPFTVEAMYDARQDLFTQVVARPLSSESSDRPAYTCGVLGSTSVRRHRPMGRPFGQALLVRSSGVAPQSVTYG